MIDPMEGIPENHSIKEQTTTIVKKQGSSVRRNPLLLKPPPRNTNINADHRNNKTRWSVDCHHLQAEEAKLAGLAISFNIRLRAADMPPAVQERALRHTRALLDSAAARRRPNPTILAHSLKKEFDSVYGPAWHCVAGKSFGSFVSHPPGGFLYFSTDSLSFLLFKTEVHVIAEPSSEA